MTRILLTGRDGQVGWELQRSLAPLGEVIALDRKLLDLSDAGAVAEAVRRTKPQIIVNAAAYTAVDKAESEEPLARSVNAIAPGVMAEEASELGALLVHYSTDYVFDGTATQPYVESDITSPTSAYGRTKEEGERLIRQTGCRHLILRTAWVYGTRGKNFMLTMLRLARERDRLRVVADQVGSPTPSRMIAESTALLLARYGRESLANTVNLTCDGSVSWHGFASRIVRYGASLGLCTDKPVDAIATAEYPTPARRPAYSVLSNTTLRTRYGLHLPAWETALELCLREMGSA